jgi:hypothetical protein
MAERPRIILLGPAGQVGRELQSSFADFGDLVYAGRDVADLRVDR